MPADDRTIIYLGNLRIQYRWGLMDIPRKTQILESFVKNTSITGTIRDLGKPFTFFLDSGAHTLFNQIMSGGGKGKGVSGRKDADYSYADTAEFKQFLDAYIAFVNQWKDYIGTYVNLDVIFNAEKSWETQKYIESCGLNPLPVFHFGEDIKYLKRYIDKYEYIGIGGLGQDITKQRFIREMGDKVFTVICDTPDHTPRVKVHGFAVTSTDLMARYPWYSVDSVSWLLQSGYGMILLPKEIGGKYAWCEQPLILPLSDRGVNFRNKNRHLEVLAEVEEDVIKKYCEYMGFDLQQLREDNKSRSLANFKYFEKVSEALPPWKRPFKVTQKAFFDF